MSSSAERRPQRQKASSASGVGVSAISIKSYNCWTNNKSNSIPWRKAWMDTETVCRKLPEASICSFESNSSCVIVMRKYLQMKLEREIVNAKSIFFVQLVDTEALRRWRSQTWKECGFDRRLQIWIEFSTSRLRCSIRHSGESREYTKPINFGMFLKYSIYSESLYGNNDGNEMSRCQRNQWWQWS